MNTKSMAGWIGFAGIVIVIVGLIDVFQGLIALLEDNLNVFAQLGFVGNSQYPLWALTALALNVVVLYALTVRWSESKADLAAAE